MKNKKTFLKFVAVAFLFAIGAVVSSCNKSADPVSGEVAQTAASESSTTSQTSETDDMATNALTSKDPASREAAMFDDDRFKCATVVISDTTTGKGSGKVTIDFGVAPGCTDKKGNTRIGKIIITWTGGRWFLPQSVHTIAFSGYSVNGVKFSDNDSRVVSNISTTASPLTWTIVANHNFTFPDASTASRTVHETRQWVRSTTIVDDKFIISQTAGATDAATGTNRHGKTYTMQITTPLEYDRSCAISNKVFLPVKGVKVITIDTNKVITIDYGTGTCDSTFTITINGHSKTITASNDSSN